MFKKIINWIKNGNDCENCPASWNERYDTECGSEWDGGCYLYGDDWPEPCHLLLPKFIREFLANRNKYLYDHQWDGYADWWEERENNICVVDKSIKECLNPNYSIFMIDGEGNPHKVDHEYFIWDMAAKIYDDYKEVNLPIRQSLGSKWRDLIKETFSIPLNFIKSYFIK